MSGIITLGTKVNQQMELLAPHYDIHSDYNPMQFKNNIKLPEAVVGTIHAFLSEEELVI